MSELRQQMTHAVLVNDFSPRTHKSYLAAIFKPIVIAAYPPRNWSASGRLRHDQP